MNSADAEKLSTLILQLNSLMNDSIWFVKEKGDGEEFLAYRRKAAEVMAALSDAMELIYAKHPDLRPRELGGNYVLDRAIFSNHFYVPASPDAV
jgi:hypothetical protein